MHIYIGVVWYKNPHEDREFWIRGALNAIEGARNTRFSIVEVDNSEANFGSQEAVRELGPGVPLLSLSSYGNIGFGAGHNRLMSSAFLEGADFYIGVNPDGAFHRQSLSRLIPRLAAEPSNLYEMRQFPTEHPKHYSPDTGETLWVSGAAFAMSKTSWETIGGFDEAFFMYCEDVDLSWRFRLRGNKCITVADSLYYHNAANRKSSPLIQQRFLLSGLVLGKKYGIDTLVQRCEAELVSMGVPLNAVASDMKLPAELIEKFDPRIYFSSDFSFSPVRWSL